MYNTEGNNQLAMLGSTQSGSSISTNESFMHIAHSRVMSPTQANLQVLYDSNIGLLGIRGVICRQCHLMSDDPVICAHCGKYGHASCIRLVYIHDMPLCDVCKQEAIIYMQANQESHQVHEWKVRLQGELGS